VNIHNILWLNAGMEMHVPMVTDMLNNALMHSCPLISQMQHQILHVSYFCTLDLLLNYTPDFVVNSIEIWTVRQPQNW